MQNDLTDQHKYANRIIRFCKEKCGSTSRLQCWLFGKRISKDIIRLSKKVYKELGWGWREDVYREALAFELRDSNYLVEAEVTSSINYRGRPLQYVNFRIDLLVEKNIVVELKACAGDGRTTVKAHQQCLRYLRMTNLGFGLVINFPEKENQVIYTKEVTNT